MATVLEALQYLVLPVKIALAISVFLWIVSLAMRQQGRAAENRIIELAQKKLAAAKDTEGNLSPGAAKIDVTVEEVRRLRPTRAFLAHIPYPVPPATVAAVIGAMLAVWVGIYVLYVPMVSTAYSRLYDAYCTVDAVGQLLTKQAGSANFAALPSSDGCSEPPSKAPAVAGDPSKPPLGPSLGRGDVFFLLNALGLLESREKTANDLFNNEPLTNNHELASALSDASIYSLGKPTNALLVALAARLGAGSDANSGHKPGQPTASEAACRSAGLAAVMAQQPFLLRGRIESAGQALLASPGITSLSALIKQAQEKLDAPPDGSKLGCAPQSELASHGLGPSFQALVPCSLPVRCPLIDQPDRVNDSEIVNIALAWGSWKPKDPPKASEQAVIAFMRNISSQASGTPLVRDARIGANFFVGWERMSILVVAAFLTLCLLWQQMTNLADKNDLSCIQRTTELTIKDPRLMIAALAILRPVLYRRAGRSAPRELLTAALDRVAHESNSLSRDYQRIRRAAEQELRILDRSRFFFLAALPLLPTIGFIGTVHSLIQALAIADNIPRARDAVDQVTAVSDVTATLSLCFSTTLMALLALLIFAPLDLWQSTGERRVVEETERLLDRSF